MRYKILKSIFFAWVALWIVFTARELFVKDNIRGYRILLSRSLEGKRSYVTGDSLYEFLTFCKDRTPQGATYAMAGLDEGSIDKRRAVYYLYPRLERASGPDLMLVYNKPGTAKSGYVFLAGLDDSRYILRKAE